MQLFSEVQFYYTNFKISSYEFVICPNVTVNENFCIQTKWTCKSFVWFFVFGFWYLICSGTFIKYNVLICKREWPQAGGLSEFTHSGIKLYRFHQCFSIMMLAEYVTRYEFEHGVHVDL